MPIFLTQIQHCLLTVGIYSVLAVCLYVAHIFPFNLHSQDMI